MLMAGIGFLSTFVDPPAPKDLTGYFGALLSTAGVLFGLAFAALLFVLESGFSSFRFSRRMFIEVYVHFGRSLLISLAYLTVLPFAILYLPFSPILFSLAYYLFACLYAKSVLDHYHQLGMLHTTFSTAFVPSSYGSVRRYTRYITNLGCLPVSFLIMLLAILLVYPVAVSMSEHGSWTITPKGFFYSSLLVLCHAMLRVTRFIPEFFRVSTLELDSRVDSEAADSSGTSAKVSFEVERKALRRFLISRGVRPDSDKDEQFIDGRASLHLLDDNSGPEAWFNVFVEVNDATNFQIRNEVFAYAIRLFSLLSESKVDLNQFVLSFHVKIDGDTRSRNMFFRTTRAELENVLRLKDDPVLAAHSVKNRLFDELFRNLS